MKPQESVLPRPLIEAYNAMRKPIVRDRICHAPFVSMRFTHSGNILACCYNRYYQLGRYPDNHLNEIWFGRKAQQLRQRLLNADFSAGCQGCYLAFINRNFHGVKAR